MKKSVLLAIGFLAFSVVSAQDSTKVNKGVSIKAIEIGVMFAPGYGSRTYSYEGDWGADSYPNIESNKSGDAAIFVPDIGLRVALNLHRFMGVEFGVGYGKKGYRFDAIEGGYASSAVYDRYEFLYRYHYIDVPVKFVVKTDGPRIRFRATLGLMTHILVESERVRTLVLAGGDEHVRLEQYDKNPVNLSPIVSVGVDVTVTPKFGLRLEPRFQHQLFRNDSDPLEVRFWSAGVGLTAYFNREGK